MEASSQDDLREQAKKRLEAKRELRNFAFTFVVVSALLIGIWAITDSGFFWPVFPIAGMAIALAFQAWNVYGQKPISDADIEREVKRQQRS